MRVLVDAHAFFRWVNDSPELSTVARDAIAAGDNEFLVSAVVAWEFATKARRGKWREAVGLAADIAFVLQH